MTDLNITSTENTIEKKVKKSSHPSTCVMVKNALQNLNERGGSSLQAIKKYISLTYKVDVEKLSSYIKKFIKNSVASGILIQTKGKGASGSFKLASKTMSKKIKSGKKTSTRKAKPSKAKKTVAKTIRKPKYLKPKTIK